MALIQISKIHVKNSIFYVKTMDVNGNTTLSVKDLKDWLFDRVGDDNDIGMDNFEYYIFHKQK